MPPGILPNSAVGMEILEYEEKLVKEQEQKKLQEVSGPEDIGELAGPSGPFDLQAHVDAIKNVPEYLKPAGEHLYENKFAYTLGTLGAFAGPVASAGLSAVATGIDTYLRDEEDDKILRDVGLSLGIDTAVLATLKIPPFITRAIVNKIKGGADP